MEAQVSFLRESELNNNIPLVSVGIPTYNRPAGLRRALECITSQTYMNLEIIVSDNCSPGMGTEAVIREFMEKDNRIQYFKQEKNKGSLANFVFVLYEATGKYFMWAADDDAWDPTYVWACVNALEQNSAAVLCTTSAVILDQDGNFFAHYDEDVNTVGLSKIARIEKVLMNIARNTSFYGVGHRSVFQTGKFRRCYGGDHIYMVELSLYGEFICLPCYSFYSRMGGAGNSPAGIMETIQVNSLTTQYLPNLSFFCAFFWSVFTWPNLSYLEQLQAARLVVKRFTSPPYPERMQQDLLRLLLSITPLALPLRLTRRVFRKVISFAKTYVR